LVDHVTGNQSSKLLKMTEKNPAFQIRLRFRCKKRFVAI
jgi:hypothetical protein